MRRLKNIITTLIITCVQLPLYLSAATIAGVPTDYDYNGPVVKELTVVQKGEAKELTISYNDTQTVFIGEKRNVKLRHTVRGHIMYRLIGQIKVEEFIAKGEARCKVVKGNKEIYNAYIETPDLLYIE